MSDKEDYLTSYRVFFENFAATVNPEDQLPVNIAGYTITEAEVPGEVLYWITQYLTEKQCPLTLMTPLRRIILDEVQVASKKQPNEFGYKADESVYIALRLMQAVTARVNEVCLRYQDNSKLDTLPPPPPPHQRDLKTVSCATKNSRRVMEDRHVEIGNLEALFGIETSQPTCFYAVYDGHAGSAAATYCAAHLHQYLVESQYFHTDLERALRDAFLRTDADFIRKSNQERACGGSTAVAVCVRARRMLCAWAGDSLALLAKRMRLMQLVRPHKPDREDEKERITSSGGTVMFWGIWRVNGQLAVSRAIGDAQYKPYVTARPEIAAVDLDGDEDFIVVACDGLWDFVSEDDVALTVYRQIAANPDDLNAVTKLLTVLAKRQGSSDNISIIVVFLKDPRDIAADNCPPMDLGLDNALANATPFGMETEACKLDVVVTEAETVADAKCDADNGVDHSDSDSEDLGPETAVDADDLDAEVKNHEPAPPTPPAHTVEANHVDGALVDNVAESGEESEDEWNYFKGEGDREPTADDQDEPVLSETCQDQDNSAWESSSVDMNSSPLNPDAPVFIPGTAAGDTLLAQSPRKPLPMDDIELPDVAQFEAEAVGRPAELLDLDNSDQLNGHHNISMEGVTEHINGNDKCAMDSLGFGFGVGPEKDSALIQNFDRIQKDTTDFCNIQVFQAHTETNPFAEHCNDELFERLKNKERDPMSMSFYQEKDDDTCERLARVDLNAVQTLPDCDEDDDAQDKDATDKENFPPEPNNDLSRPNNDSNFNNFLPDFATNAYSNMDVENDTPQEVVQTDTPESHKLMFEQIPEIPDGKSSELGFNNDDAAEPDLSPEEPEIDVRLKEEPIVVPEPELVETEPVKQNEIEVAPEATFNGFDALEEHAPAGLVEPITPEAEHDIKEDVVVDVHQHSQPQNLFEMEFKQKEIEKPEHQQNIVDIQFENEPSAQIAAASPAPSPLPMDECLIPVASPAPAEAPAASPSPAASPLPVEECLLPAASPAPTESPLPAASPVPEAALLPVESPLPAESPLPTESPLPAASPVPVECARLAEASAPAATPEPAGPAPDIVPEEPVRTELVTDIDIGIPESHAQEICVPVTCEIRPGDGEVAPGTPPPTPAVAPAPAELEPTPIAADPPAAAAAALTVTAVAGAAAVAAAAAVKSAKSTPIKKSPTTPKPASALKSSTTQRTPLSAKKPATSTTTPAARSPAASKTTPARTPTAAAAKTMPARPAAAAATTKAAAPGARTAPARTSAPAAARPAPRPTTLKSTAAKEPAAAKTTAAPRAASAAARPASRPAAARPAAAAPRPATAPAAPRAPISRPAPTAPRAPISRPAPAAARPRPAVPAADKKPLTNGDVKPAAARPAPRPAPAARPAPRPTPRSAPATATTKSSTAAPLPAPRAARPAADKPSKDLANKRLSAKAAPPRTAPAKTGAGTGKPVPVKVPKKPVAVSAVAVAALNGAAEALKPPPSPPPADNALPDVIA